jgi:glucokinase
VTQQQTSWVIGVDLGATKIAAGLVDPDNEVVKTVQVETRPEAGATAVVERIAECISALQTALPSGESLAALGICCPGPLDHVSGVVFDPPNLTGWQNVPLRQMLADRLGLPITLEHDAKAAALGEYYYGAGRGERSMVYIVVGTGVGAAIIIDGHLYRGMHNTAGEVGHITIDWDGEPGSSGVKGCVESFMSGPYLVHQYQRLTQASDPALTGELVARRAIEGDALAQQVMTQAGAALGTTVASLAMILDIDLYVIGGSVIKAGNLLLEPARQAVPHYSFASVATKVRIMPIMLGHKGPILGCAWLARQSKG